MYNVRKYVNVTRNILSPMKAMSPRAIAAFVAAEDRAAARPPPPPASSGMATKSGTTARS